MGGKSKLIEILIPKYINNISGRFIEPFCGGCSLAAHLNLNDMVLNDANEKLIRFYKQVALNSKDVVDKINSMKTEFNKSSDKTQEYCKLRSQFNSNNDEVTHAALFWIINKICFNGLYRVNKSGEFNAHFGNRDCPDVDTSLFSEFSKMLNKSHLLCEDFSSVCENAKSGDVVYLDPPYIPISETASFEKYVKSGFGLRNHELLCKLMIEMNGRGVKMVLSNSNCSTTHDIYKELLNHGFKFDEIETMRKVSCKTSSRGKAKELIIYN